MLLIQQDESEAARRQLFVQMVSDVDYVTPETGLTLAVQMVKAGAGSYASIAGSSQEVGSGTYRIDLAADDLDTAGAAMVKVTATGAVDQFIPLQVVRFPDEVHLAKAALVNARSHTIETGVDQIKDDDGMTVLRTLTPDEVGGIITVTPA